MAAPLSDRPLDPRDAVANGRTAQAQAAGEGAIAAWHVVVHPMEGMHAVVSMIGNGVIERFPRLRRGSMEAGCGRLPS